MVTQHVRGLTFVEGHLPVTSHVRFDDADTDNLFLIFEIGIMTSTKTDFIPFMKEGADEFSRQVHSYHNRIEVVSELILHFLGKVIPINGQPFVIGDYGTADGGTSYSLIQKAIAVLRNKHGEDLPISVVYEDQPINDFKAAFLRANGLIPGTPGLAANFSNVYVLANGSSFFSQCMPANSMDFIVCFMSIHWLSKRPLVPGDTLFPTTSHGSVLQSFREQAAEDWETFLLMRAKELKPGGYVVVTLTSVSPEDGREGPALGDIMSLCTRVWEGLLQDRIITKGSTRPNHSNSVHVVEYARYSPIVLNLDFHGSIPIPVKFIAGMPGEFREDATVEFERTQFLMHLRSPEEVKKPFKDDTSSVLRSGLRLERVQRYILKNPSIEKCDAKALTRETRAWQEGTLLRGLADDRPAGEKRKIIDTYFERFFELVALEPSRLRARYVLYAVVIRKDRPQSP